MNLLKIADGSVVDPLPFLLTPFILQLPLSAEISY